jgi:predicted oxidoreductase
MNIEKQTKLAKHFTQKLAKYIEKNNSTMNKDGRGCCVESIHITYGTGGVVFEVGFKSSDNIESPVTNFYCRETIY